MARVAAFVPDLLFGSRVQGDLQAVGHEVVLAHSPAALSDALTGANALVVDLTAEAPQRIEAVGGLIPAGLPVLAFYSHVETEVRDLGRRAGFDLVVPRSRMAREGAGLLARLLGEAHGPGME
jgi:hypothetical protein